MKKILINKDGIQEVDFTAEEITEKNKDIANSKTEQTNEENYQTQKKLDQASGNQKLLDLGLTQAEATSLTGYKPPEEEIS